MTQFKRNTGENYYKTNTNRMIESPGQAWKLGISWWNYHYVNDRGSFWKTNVHLLISIPVIRHLALHCLDLYKGYIISTWNAYEGFHTLLFFFFFGISIKIETMARLYSNLSSERGRYKYYNMMESWPSWNLLLNLAYEE